MPRSPFQGSFQPGIRPTVVTAPDAMVYINGESDILGCSKCRRKFDWNRYITGVQVDLNIDSSPGSASINLSIPRHSVDEFYFDGNPLITPMMEVEIFAKGYYLLEGIPQYYPIFWGLVTEVSNNYSGGEHTFTISCADILKWWELCKMNINAAFTGPTGQGGRNLFGNVFFGMNPYDVIWTLAQQSFGDVVVGTGSLNVSVREKNKDFQGTFNRALGDIMQYWNKRFSKIRSNLLLYGTTGTAVRGDTIQAAYQNTKPQFGKPFVSQLVRQANGDASQMDFDPTDPAVVAFRTQGGQAGQVNLWQTEYQTKLELAHAAKEAIGFEFYMDVTGDIVFKPPFYNLDILSNKPVSWIQDIDIIDWDFSDSEAEVVTQIQLQGNYTGNIDWGLPEEATPLTSVTDYHLLRKYGWRSQTFNSEFLANPQTMFYVGLDMLDRYNCKRFRGSVNIPLRPELRLGFPIYIAPLDQVWYVQGISHSIQYGSRAQTTVSLTAKRGKFIAPRGIGTIELSSYNGSNPSAKGAFDGSLANLSPSQLAKGGRFKADVGEAAEIPPVNAPDTAGGIDPYEPLVLRHPKTGRIVGYPNVVMAYTRPMDNVSPRELGKKNPTDPRIVQNKIDAARKAQLEQEANIDKATHTVTDQDQLREKHLNNRYTYGINSAGVYTYLHDKSKVVKEMLLVPAKNITFNQEIVKFYGQSGMIRPVSDERGFEVVGHHRYGRGVALRDGALVLNQGKNAQVDVGIQVALSGGLIETLQAQSQGLTTLSSLYGNPVDAVARLAPDDLQTAASINPDTKKPEIAQGQTTFITNPSMNSPQLQGVTAPPDVEATQLSKALTLAEMKARSDMLGTGEISDPDCECVTGRSDLAFISTGYQVRTLNATQTDIDFHDQAAEIIQAASDKANKTLIALKASNASISGPTDNTDYALALKELYAKAIAQALTGVSPEIQQAVLSAQASASITSDQSVTNPPNPVVPGQVLNKVDAFLANLYQALDPSHQQYEKQLRGELIQVQTRTPEQVRFENAPAEISPFAPPYSASNRAAGGDPAALAMQAKTPLSQIPQAFSKFGTDLQTNTKKTILQGEINASKVHLLALEKEKARLTTVIAEGGVVIGNGSASKQLEQINKEITSETQNVANKSLKLSQINQENPP